MIQLLLDLGANLNAAEHGLTMFQQLWIRHTSDRRRDHYLKDRPPEEHMVMKFLEHGQNPDIMVQFRERIPNGVWVNRKAYPLHLACKEAEVETVQAWLEHGASANSLDSQRHTPLNLAAGHLAARIHGYLSQEEGEASHELAALLHPRLSCISMLLDVSAKLCHDPDVEESIHNDYHFAEPLTVTQAHIDALVERGFDVDSRILSLPQHGRSLVGVAQKDAGTGEKLDPWQSLKEGLQREEPAPLGERSCGSGPLCSAGEYGQSACLRSHIPTPILPLRGQNIAQKLRYNPFRIRDANEITMAP